MRIFETDRCGDTLPRMPRITLKERGSRAFGVWRSRLSPRYQTTQGLDQRRFGFIRGIRGKSYPLYLLAAAILAATDLDAQSARSSPSWLRDGVIYELNTRDFSSAGTFNAVTERLDSLKSLGVNVVWLMPIHPVGQLKKKGSIGSPYAVRDYYGINPAFGSAADLHRLIGEAHKRDMKVIIDIVANHTAWDAKLMATPAFYRRDAQGHVVSPYDWSDVAALNYDNPALRKYMTDMLVYWVREFDLDGF